MKKFGFRLPGRQKCYFLIFAFSLYLNFKWLLTKILWWILRALSNFCHVTIFLITFLTMKQRPFNFYFFEICTDMHFVSLFFLNERNITTSLLMIHLKRAVVNYANLSSSSRNKPFLNCGSLNMLFRFFSISYMFILMKRLSKNLWKNYHF